MVVEINRLERAVIEAAITRRETDITRHYEGQTVASIDLINAVDELLAARGDSNAVKRLMAAMPDKYAPIAAREK